MRRARHEKITDRRWERETGQTPEQFRADMTGKLDRLEDGVVDEDAMDREYVATHMVHPCAWGNCATDYEKDGRPCIGSGPVACPCEWSNQSTGRRWGMASRPGTPVKAVGRHGSRAQASRRRRRLLEERARVFGDVLLPARVPDFITRRVTW